MYNGGKCFVCEVANIGNKTDVLHSQAHELGRGLSVIYANNIQHDGHSVLARFRLFIIQITKNKDYIYILK